MSDWPLKATRHSPGAAFAEAQRRGLFGPDAGQSWLYMYHDIYGVAHFRHVHRQGYMQMAPDDVPAASQAEGAKSQNGLADDEDAA